MRESDFGNRAMHLANDGVQKHGDKYGKFEEGNKLSLEDFSAYLQSVGKVDGDWKDATLVPRIRELMTYSTGPQKGASMFLPTLSL